MKNNRDRQEKYTTETISRHGIQRKSFATAKNVLCGVAVILFVCSCREEVTLPPELGLPQELVLGTSLVENKAGIRLRKNLDQLEWTTTAHSGKIHGNMFFDDIACRVDHLGRVTSIYFGKSVRGEDVPLDSLAHILIKYCRDYYGEDFEIYDRQHGFNMEPVVQWRLDEGAYVSINYTPYEQYLEDRRKGYTSASNHLGFFVEYDIDPYLKPNGIYTAANLGIKKD